MCSKKLNSNGQERKVDISLTHTIIEVKNNLWYDRGGGAFGKDN